MLLVRKDPGTFPNKVAAMDAITQQCDALVYYPETKAEIIPAQRGVVTSQLATQYQWRINSRKSCRQWKLFLRQKLQKDTYCIN